VQVAESGGSYAVTTPGESSGFQYLHKRLYPSFVSRGVRMDDDKVSVVGCQFNFNCRPTMSFASSVGSASSSNSDDQDEVLVGQVPVVMGR
jgi:hypothetical protein